MSQRNERSMQWEIDSVSHWLIHHAARRAPECLSSRLEEEWLGDLEYRSTALSRLGLALGCCWTTAVIAKEYSRVQVPAARPVVAAKGCIIFADRNFGYFSLRSGTLFCGLVTTPSPTRGLAAGPNLSNQVLNSVPVEMTVLPKR
jgi:hypothetical protein